MSTTQQDKAQRLRTLSQNGAYALPNAWDAGSAAMIAQAGAPVIGTTSAGISWAQARSDGQHLSRDEMLAATRQIVRAVDVPVTADIEGGYGPEPADVAETVRGVIAAGAVGVNIEDSRADGTLFEIADQVARLRAGRETATEAGLPDLVINARTDVYLFGIGEPETRFDATIARGKALAEAEAADLLFVPGVTDIELIKKLVDASPLPINIMVGPGSPSVDELRATGVRRISTGAAIAYAAYSLAIRGAREILETGTYTGLADIEPWDRVNGAFTR